MKQTSEVAGPCARPARPVKDPRARVLLRRYRPPALRLGETVKEQDGVRVRVAAFTADGWPLRRAGRCLALTPILCAELARMVRHESSRAVQHALGVSKWTVWRWRRRLSVQGHSHPGTVELRLRLKARGS